MSWRERVFPEGAIQLVFFSPSLSSPNAHPPSSFLPSFSPTTLHPNPTSSNHVRLYPRCSSRSSSSRCRCSFGKSRRIEIHLWVLFFSFFAFPLFFFEGWFEYSFPLFSDYDTSVGAGACGNWNDNSKYVSCPFNDSTRLRNPVLLTSSLSSSYRPSL